MTTETDAGATDGADTFEQEFEAAREADASQPQELEGEGAEGEGEEQPKEEAKAAEKPPLSAEELSKRYENQKKATSAERAKRRELEQRFAALEARLTPQPGQAGDRQEERPDPEEDPIGYLQYIERKFDAEEQRSARDQEAKAQRERQAGEVRNIISRAEEFEADFRELNPDYDAAVEHLIKAKKADYAEEGYSDAEAHQAVMQEFLGRAARLMSVGKDPAEAVYNLAKKAGFTGKPTGDKLDAIARGQKATSALAGAGRGGSGEMTVETVSKLNGAAFDSAFEKLQESARRLERQTGW